MSFELHHTFVSRRFTPLLQQSSEEMFFTVNERGEFAVLFPGRLTRRVSASYSARVRVDPVDPVSDDDQPPGSTPLHGGIQKVTKTILTTLRIFTPDGREFTATEITLADLRKFRDPRGRPSGRWSYTLKGESEHISFSDEDSDLETGQDPNGSLLFGVIETVASESAPPLVNNVPVAPTPRSFQFDLYRVGNFVAEISQQIDAQWRGSMRLIDPDGVAVARTTGRKLKFAVGLPTLNKSRDADGKVRKWKLEVSPQSGVVGSHRISATVIGSGRITIAALKSRIDALLGPSGEFIHIFGENKGGEARGRLRITDVVSAETIDMHGLLDNLAKDVGTGDTPGEVLTNTIYTLFRKDEIFSVSVSLPIVGEVTSIDLKVNCNSLKVDTIKFAIGPGVMLGASVPAVKLTVEVSGAAKITSHGFTLAEAKVRGGKFAMEVGIKLAADGTPKIVTAVPDSVFDIDLNDAAMAALLVAFPLLAGLLEGKVEARERELNDDIVDAARNLFSDPTLAPTILMTIFGAHLTYKPFHFEGQDIVFDHIAPVEPEPKPTPGYQGAIGRSFTQLTPDVVTFQPPLLGNTWRADNLSKIDHIVVVMMENRSYDHVLGYRALNGFNETADGLTATMIEAIEKAPKGPFDVKGLREALFAKNQVGKMTRLPKGVGHELEDVAQQLSVRAAGPGGNGRINSPKGFVDNFKPRLTTDPQGVVADDVLGFYDEKDLPFYAYLAENYAYCDRYYCSHPGPTMPNRMYSLTGDLQHDRFGFPLFNNNNSDNFLLSRAPTIYDLLMRKAVSFRVYESFPSVTMLRMFARYATDTTNIVPLDRLAADVERGDLPAFTVIEPAMHHHPQNDDHPDADMHRGQIFVKDVYKILSSRKEMWEKTLLIITYDEHGGLYDHVVPPVAELIRTLGSPLVIASPTGGEPPLTPQAAAALLPIPYGVRVPTFVVSPLTMRGKGPNLTLDHCSILKTVLARFLGNEKPFLSDRVSASHSFDAFLTEAAPRTVPKFDDRLLPGLPIGVRSAPSRTTKIVTKPLTRQEMREGPVDSHELMGRWARQLGR